MQARKVEDPVSPEVLERWRQEWESAGHEAVAMAVQGRAPEALVYEDGFGAVAKREAAGQWLKEKAKERNQQLRQAKADQRMARWHSWTNTIVAILALLVALVALFKG